MRLKTLVMFFFLISVSSLFGQNKDSLKLGKEWNFLYSDLWNPKQNFKGLIFTKSNSSQTKYLGVGFYVETESHPDTSSRSFEIKQVITRDIYGYTFTDTITFKGSSISAKKTKEMLFHIDFRFLPNELRGRKKIFKSFEFENGFFLGGISEFVITEKTTNSLISFANNDSSRTIQINNVPAFKINYNQSITYGFFVNVRPLTFFIFGKTPIIATKKRATFFSINFGVKF